MSAALKLSPQPNIKLNVQQGPHAGQRFSFSKSRITIGRSPENDIILVNDPLISRQHAYIEIVDNDVEIVNLSQKNPVLVNNESVTKWKLTNDAIFVVGGSEFLIQIENLQSVVVMKQPAPTATPVALVKNTQTKPVPVVARQPAPKIAPSQPIAPPRPQVFMQSQPLPTPQKVSVSPRMKFYGIIGLVVVAGLYLGLSSSGDGAKKVKKPTLKYADEITIKINSTETADTFKRQEALSKVKQSNSFVRAEENFNKGMRAFQLNNYTSAIDYFQLTLISQPDHILAKRYSYLAKVRFDEILKAKIELGQSYFQRNNFKLCKAMFQQVIDMLAPQSSSKEVLQGSAKGTNLQLAQIMVKKCEFAAEGIH